MAKAKVTYKLTVKDGDSSYRYNEKTGQYDFKTIDFVEEYDNLGLAIRDFLDWATDDYLENKVTLTITPKGKEKK